MAVLKCKLCGGNLQTPPGENIGACDSCGARLTLPQLHDDRRVNLYNRANQLRRAYQYEQAAALYENILAEDASDAEAYWSLVLCRFGVEYVEDPGSRALQPTCNRAQLNSVYEDEDYKQAVAHAQGEARFLYEQEAEKIDAMRQAILDISTREAPYDIFICCKEMDQRGRRSADSVLAQDICDELEREGYRVFFARRTLAGKPGVAYEPYIFAALNSAAVMLVVVTRKECAEAVWVQNEWRRYLALCQSNRRKTLVPVYRDMRPQDLPEALRRLQGQNMDQLGAMQDLIGGVRKLVSPARSGGQAAVAAGSGLLLVNGTVAPAAEIRLSADGREALGYAGAAAALLNIPAGVGAIAAGAFSGCPLTETVVLPEGITAIGAGAFSACPRLSGVIFPDSLQSIGENAFAGCGALQRVSLEEGLRDIGAGAFKNCAALQDIYWGDNIRRLGAGAFAGCGLGPRLELPPGLENIGENAFADCAALEEVVVPASLGCVGSGAFGGCQALRRVILDKGAASSVIPAFSRWGGEALAAIRPQIEISDNITAIGAGAFAACTYLRHIVIPGQVKRIEENAFAGCSALRRVDMSGPKLESICRRAFAGCAALQKLQLPAGLKFIGAEAFAGCEALTSLTFPEGLEIVEEGAFRDCAGLTAIAAPGAMPPNYRASGLNEGPPRLALHMRRHVADGAGAGFQAIKTLSFDKDIVHIGAGAFENCGGLTHLRLPRELQSIGDGAFAGCGALSGGLKFAPAIRIIGAGAFAGCAALEYLTLAPAYNCSIGKDAFGGCRGLKSVKFDSGASISIGEGAFRGCSGLRELRAPQAGDLKAGAFADCHGLTRLVITGEHTGLGEGAFRSCLRLAEVEFSANPEYYLPMDFTRIFAGAPYLARVDSGVCLKCGARSRRRFCQKCLRPLARAGRRLLSGANPMLLALLLLLAGLLLPYLIKLLTEALNRA